MPQAPSAPLTVWRRVAGDHRHVHLFSRERPRWWRAACGVGQGVGGDESDAVLDPCPTCFEHETSETGSR